jgi:transcriptional regulator with XRE-family HTH domain
MTSNMQQGQGPGSEWIRALADAEDRCQSVTVGGLAHDLGMLQGPEPLRVLGRLIEFARRAKGLSLEDLARSADVDLAELVAIERDMDMTPTPRTMSRLAHTLALPPGKLMELSGLAEPCDEALGKAALRFAARSEPMAELSKNERAAFEEFVKVLAENSRQGCNPR